MLIMKVLMYWTLLGGVVAIGFGKLCAAGRGEDSRRVRALATTRVLSR